MHAKYMRTFIKPTLIVLFFASLSITFYFALMDALKKHKDNPITLSVRKKPKSKDDLAMEILYGKSAKWMSQSRDKKLQNLLDNPVFKQFKLKKPKRKKFAHVLIIVSSGPRRVDRRNAIRETWWKDCKKTGNGVIPSCYFFTDRVKPTSKFYTPLEEESEKHKDILFQPLRGGIEFGVRFLYHMVWALTNYHFDYFVRVDDDYFFCLERFLWEIPLPMVRGFHWGFVHCILEIVRPEESMILMSRDLMEHFILQDPFSMRCHPWADQMIGVWVTDLGDNFIFRHDDRLHHAPIVDQMPKLRDVEEKCAKYIGIHGTYPADMRLFWKQKGTIYYNFTSKEDRIKQIGDLTTNSAVCELVHNFNYLIFEPEWQYEPKRCIYNPIWNTKKQTVIGGVYSGRQEDKRLAEDGLKLKKKFVPPTKETKKEDFDEEPFDGA